MNPAKKLLALFAIVCVFAATARAQESAGAPASTASAPEPQFHFETVFAAHGKIDSIDRERRLVTITWDNGQKGAVEAHDPKKLETINVGDRVKLEYIEGVAIRKKKPGEKLPLLSLKQGIIEARPGEAPMKGAHRRAEFVASVAESWAAVTGINEHRWAEGWEPFQEELDKERPGVLKDLPTILNGLRQFVEAYEKEFANATDWTPVPGETLGHRYPYVRKYLG